MSNIKMCLGRINYEDINSIDLEPFQIGFEVLTAVTTESSLFHGCNACVVWREPNSSGEDIASILMFKE
jgi:hypothetical protein